MTFRKIRKVFQMPAVAVVCLISIYFFFDGPQKSCSHVGTVYFNRWISKNISGGIPVSFYDTENPYDNIANWKTFQEALMSYKDFHKAKLAEMKTSPNGGSVRTLTWACEHMKSVSGIGDQMLRVQYFFLLAMMSDRLFLIHWDDILQKSAQHQLIPGEIDWSYYDEEKGLCSLSTKCAHDNVYDRPPLWHIGWDWTTAEHRNFGNDLFSSALHITVSCRNPAVPMRIPLIDPGAKILQGFKKMGVQQIFAQDNDTIHYRSRELFYNILHYVGASNIIELPKVEKAEVRINEGWVYFSHYIMTYLFHFPGNLLKRIEFYQKKMELNNQDYLALHLRTGFQGTPRQENFFDRYYMSYRWKLFPDEKDWGHFIKHAISIRDEVLGRHKPIYLSTDSTMVKDYINTHYRGQHIHWMSLKAMHSALKPKGCMVTFSGEGILSLWMDYFLLANAKFLVHSYSSFALSASLVRPIPHRFHSWVMYNYSLGCLASHRLRNVTCIDT